MSFVSKGEKKMRNMVKKGSSPGERPLQGDGFGKKGDGRRSGADHNMAPGSKDKTKYPVSENADGGSEYDSGPTEAKSEYDPASGKRAKSVADLRMASKKLSEKSDAGMASPTGSESGQDGKHLSSSKNESGFMKTGSPKMKKPRALASQEDPDMDDPMDEGMEENGLHKQGMTPKGTSRAKSKSLKDLKRKLDTEID